MTINKTIMPLFLFIFIFTADSYSQELGKPNNIGVSAPIDTESTAKGGDVATTSVFKINCRPTNSQGTGFLHKSGNIITAAHVVKNCHEPEIVLSVGTIASSKIVASDDDVDLAIISPTFPIETTPLTISSKTDLRVGSQVSTWGFPGGYSGLVPMLSVGYLSGMQAVKPANKIEKQWVINAAFNHGNSGGPLLEIETGEVVGVVSSKVVQLSNLATSALFALQKQRSGLQYPATDSDGSQRAFSEGQITAMVLEELRNQEQLVIGNAVRSQDIRAFLQSQKIDP